MLRCSSRPHTVCNSMHMSCTPSMLYDVLLCPVAARSAPCTWHSYIFLRSCPACKHIHTGYRVSMEYGVHAFAQKKKKITAEAATASTSSHFMHCYHSFSSLRDELHPSTPIHLPWVSYSTHRYDPAYKRNLSEYIGYQVGLDSPKGCTVPDDLPFSQRITYTPIAIDSPHRQPARQTAKPSPRCDVTIWIWIGYGYDAVQSCR